MNSSPERSLSTLLILILILASAKPVFADHKPQPMATSSGGFTTSGCFGACGDGKYVALAAVGVGAVAGLSIYFLVRKGPSLTGCVDADAAGLELKDEGSQRVYTLIGETGNIKPGERVQVYGKKEKSKTDPHFLIKHLPKALGPCKATP